MFQFVCLFMKDSKFDSTALLTNVVEAVGSLFETNSEILGNNTFIIIMVCFKYIKDRLPK